MTAHVSQASISEENDHTSDVCRPLRAAEQPHIRSERTMFDRAIIRICRRHLLQKSIAENGDTNNESKNMI